MDKHTFYEFFGTYGWAIISIVIATILLYAFGYIGTDNFLPRPVTQECCEAMCQDVFGTGCQSYNDGIQCHIGNKVNSTHYLGKPTQKTCQKYIDKEGDTNG